MSKRNAIILFATVAAATAGLPCSAQDSGLAKKMMVAPVRVAGCLTALMVGTPIAMARLSARSFHECAYGDADIDGAPTGGDLVLALPMGIGQGLSQGIYYGPRNAFVNFDKPFSKDAMSLRALMPERN